MRLSEAIRLGSMLKPKSEGEYRSDDGKSCALGAVMDALGVPVHEDVDFEIHALEVEYPFLLEAIKCPACSFLNGIRRRRRGDEYDLEDVIIHLNDDHKWSRQRIANWVQTVEPQMVDEHQAAGARFTPVDRGTAIGSATDRASSS